VYELGFVTQAQVPPTQFSLEQSLLPPQWAPTGETQAGTRPIDELNTVPQKSVLQHSALPVQEPR
jgi:hypothetical protein